MMRFFKKLKNIIPAFAGAWLGLFGVGMMNDTALARTNDGKVFGQVRGDESFSQLPRKADYKNMPYVPGKTWLMINGTEPGKSIPGQVVRVVQELTGQQLIKIKDPDQAGVFYTDVTIDPKHPFMEDPSIGLVKGKFGMKPFHGSMEDDAKEELAKLLAVVDAENKAGRIAAVVKPSVVTMPTLMAARSNDKPKAPVVAVPTKKSEPVPPPVIDFARALPTPPPAAKAVVIQLTMADVVPPVPQDVGNVVAQYNDRALEDRALASGRAIVDNIRHANMLEAFDKRWQEKVPPAAVSAFVASLATRAPVPTPQRTPMTVQNSNRDQARTDDPNPTLKDIFVTAVTSTKRTIVNKEIAFAQYELNNGETYQIATDSCIADGCLRAYKAAANGNFEWVDLRKDAKFKDLHDELLKRYKARHDNAQVLAA